MFLLVQLNGFGFIYHPKSHLIPLKNDTEIKQ